MSLKKYFCLVYLFFVVVACEETDEATSSPDFTIDIVGNYSGTLIISGSDGNRDTLTNQSIIVEKRANNGVQFRPFRGSQNSQFPADIILSQSYNTDGVTGRESYWEVLDDAEEGGTGIEGGIIGVKSGFNYDVLFAQTPDSTSIQYVIKTFQGGVEITESFIGQR